MREIPESLRSGPFTRTQARDLGVTKAMFAGQRFVRVHLRAWRYHEHTMSWDDEICAARLALPSTAQPTHVTRIQQLGLTFGPRHPLHLVVQGKPHLALDGIFLHRTKLLAPPTRPE